MKLIFLPFIDYFIELTGFVISLMTRSHNTAQQSAVQKIDILLLKELRSIYSPGAKGLKWRFFAHESVQAEFGLKL